MSITSPRVDWINDKTKREITSVGYATLVLSQLEYHSDFLFSLADLFLPKLIKIDEIYIQEFNYNPEYYETLKSAGNDELTIMHWMTLFLVTDAFADLNQEEEFKLAKILAESWTAKFSMVKLSFQVQFIAVYDDEQDETFVVLNKDVAFPEPVNNF